MKIKKYLAPTLREATEKMKNELGDEAIILSTRVVEENGLSGKIKLFEITSGVEEENFETALESNEVLKSSFMNEVSSFSLDKMKSKLTSSISTPNYTSKLNSLVKKPIENDLKEVVDTLINHEVQKPLIKMVVNHLKKSKNLLNSANLEEYVISCLSSMIPTVDFKLAKGKKSKVVAVVGPTGVGKTTSIAKLAAISKILHNLDVGIISIDTYRLGAIDQLRIFSEISNIDLLVAYEPEEMPGLLARLKNKDLIFIDTVGRNPKNKEELKKIRKFLDEIKVDETFLVLSATSSAKNMMDAADKFGMFNYTSFLFSKIDEAITYGNLMNVSSHYNKPIIFLTNGQVIPDDIISADSEYIAKIIYSGQVG